MMEFTKKLDEKIEKLQNEIHQLQNIKELTKTYPDLKEVGDSWNQKYYVSKHVNAIVDEVHITHACGCCSDSTLLAKFFTTVNGIKIYADPYSVAIGKGYSWGFGDVPNENWREDLQQHGIVVTKELEEKIETYFKENPPESYDDEEDEE